MIKRFWDWLIGAPPPEKVLPKVEAVKKRVEALEVRVTVLERKP